MIAEGKPIDPVELWRFGRNHTIHEGNHRIAASVLLGFQFVPARFLSSRIG
jgi:hypothetical protein